MDLCITLINDELQFVYKLIVLFSVNKDIYIYIYIYIYNKVVFPGILYACVINH